MSNRVKDDKPDNSKTEHKVGVIIELIETVVIALILALLVRTFVLQAFYIPSSSMENTLKPGDRILVNKFIYKFKKPVRGDIIVFKSPEEPSRDFIKRVVGLENETLSMKEGILNVDGRPLKEDYIKARSASDYLIHDRFRNGVAKSRKIPKGHLFMMGDNRNNSDDSRFWGPLPAKLVKGKAMAVYWPPTRIRLIRSIKEQFME